MSVTLVVLHPEDGGQTFQALHQHLNDEADLRGLVRRAYSGGSPGELGVGGDALTVALGAGGAFSVLATSLKYFFAQPRRSDVVIEIRLTDGTEIKVDAKRVENVPALIAEIRGEHR